VGVGVGTGVDEDGISAAHGVGIKDFLECGLRVGCAGTRIGAATIEVMSEGYFFKEIKEKNADETSFFRNTYPLSYIIAPMIAIPTLLFVPSFKYLFLIVTVFLLLGLLVTLRLKDIK